MIQSRFINKFSVGAFFAITEKVKEDRLRLCNLRPLRIAAIDGGRSAPPSHPPPQRLYSPCPSRGAMDINALVISGSDPGAVPGGSTIPRHLRIMGPK